MNKKLSVSLTARLLPIWCLIFFAFFALGQAQAATFVVNSTADTDDGACTTAANGCTLREAINAANTDTTADSITFNIGTDTPTVALTSGLPTINNPVTIDGATGGATRVEINGNSITATGLFLDGNGNTIKNLVINRFNGRGIILNTSNNNTVQGCFIGTNASGTATSGFGNGGSGIYILSSSGNTIGGTIGTTQGGSCTGTCNLLSGSIGTADGIAAGINIESSSSNTIEGNFIGTDVTGTLDLGNAGNGIRSFNPSSNQIGGTTAAARNVISGNDQSGISLNSANGTTIQGNFIGTNSAGTVKIGNAYGIRFLSGGSVTIGGATAGAGNVISGNATAGIYGATTSSTIQGNFIGTDLSGTRNIGNGVDNGSGLDARGGVALTSGSSGNTIGGTAAGAANIIAFNSGAGVRLGSSNNGSISAASAGNPIRGNVMYLNNGLGISLSDGGGILSAPLANDTLDPDTGANNRQNYPVLTTASASAGMTTAQGTFNSLANTTFAIDFYANENQDSSGYGEGQTYVGTQNVTTDGSGNANISFSYSTVAGKPFTTATATNSTTNDTSEFSNAVLLAANPGTFVFSSPTYSIVESGGTATITITRANGSTGAACINYATGNGTATAGSDYAAASGQLCFADGETSKTFTVTIINDTTPESDETVNLTLSNPTNGSALGLQSTANLTIINDDSFQSLVVNSTADTDDGACAAVGTGNGCTLREAINAANATPAQDSIVFNIGAGNPTITVTSALPAINAPIVIDGSAGAGGATRVEINGNSVSANGLTLNSAASRSTIRRLVINRFNGNGIVINGGGNNNVIESNYIGTDFGGTIDLGNAGNGISFATSSNNIIGGTTGTTPGGACTGACNLISGNGSAGISADAVGGAANANVIQGNFIGTNASGTAALGNSGRGITFLNAVNNTQIGGASASARNLISGNGDIGVFLSAAGINGNVIQGNYIGVDTTATAKIGNAVGVTLYFGATNNSIIGNVISGNVKRGIELDNCLNSCSNAAPHDNIVQSNFIGTDPTGTQNLGNGQANITVEPVGGITFNAGTFNNKIGGTGVGNVIAFNYGAGIRLGANSSYPAAGAGNSILNNSIYSNNGLGIALSDGTGIISTALANDAGDADTGANNRQNYPVLSSALTNGGATAVQGTLDSTTGATYRIQFFSDATCDSSGNGEGRIYLGELTSVSPNTTFTFNSASAVAVGQVITATATNGTTSDTSEFSACRSVTAPPDTTAPTVTSIDDGDADDIVTKGTTLTYTVAFNEDIDTNTVTAADFDNAGTATITIGTIAETSPGIFTVQVTPTSAGTLKLRIPSGAVIRDNSNNALVVPVTDDTTVTVNLPDNFTAFTVTKTADTNDGVCDSDCSLREAITAANNDAGAETINFSLVPNDPGYDAVADVYTLTLASALPDLSTDIMIVGPGAAYVVISGNNSVRVFNISSGANVKIAGLTISGGNSGNGGGGGIQNNGNLTLTANAISGNTAGGIGGGAVYNGGGAIVNIVGSTINDNNATNGGGIAGNGTINITNSTITGNSASFGGGVLTFDNVVTTLTVTGSTISNNSSVNFGGGIAHQNSTPAILRNTIVANNTAGTTGPDLSGAFNSQGYNLIGNGSGATITPTTGDQIGTAAAPIDPRFGPLQYNGGSLRTRALLAGSPAIDKGKSFGLTTDQRDAARPVDLDDAVYPDASDASDIGAYEAQTVPSDENVVSFVVTKTADTNDGACDSDCSLREAITAANANPGADTITFDIGGANPRIIQLTGALPDLSQSVKILNASGESITVRRNTGGDYRIFTINAGQNVLISGLTITNGNDTGGTGGGGILNIGSSLTLLNSTVSGNTTTGFAGGGIYSFGGSILNVTNSTVSGNSANGNGNGGGIAGNGTITITSSTISDNTAVNAGGGIIAFPNTTLTVTSSTVSNNSAQGSNFGGGIDSQGTSILRNTIVADNTAPTNPDLYGTFNSEGYNLIENTSGATINETQNAGTNITGQDPNLGALQNNGGQTKTRALQTGSPAIDKGKSFGLTTDQRGSARPVDMAGTTNAADGADIGAFELSSALETGKEGDTAARPNGDTLIQSDDLIQLRRFLNGADTPDSTTTNEFQRADTAPYETRGDGALCSNDLIQLRRYLNGADASQAAGGLTTPTSTCAAAQSAMAQIDEKNSSETEALDNFNETKDSVVQTNHAQAPGVARELRVESPSPTSAGQTVTVKIRVDALGDESAYAFRLNYNQMVLTNPIINENGTTGAAIIDCDTSVTNRIGCTAEAFPINQSGSNSTSIKEIGAGNNQLLLSITFTVATNAAAQSLPLTLSDVSTSNDRAQNLAITPTNGSVTITGPTAASVSISGRVKEAVGGTGIGGITVSLLKTQSGEIQTTATSEDGAYQFENLPVGETYIITPQAGRYSFVPSSKVISLTEESTDIDFTALSQKSKRRRL